MRATKATWTSADGTTRRIVDMSDEHLENTINWLKRHEIGQAYGNRAHQRARRLLRKLPALRSERERRHNLPYQFTAEDHEYIELLVTMCRFMELHDKLFGPPPQRLEYDEVVGMTPDQVMRAMNSGLRIHIGMRVRENMRPRFPTNLCPRPFRYS